MTKNNQISLIIFDLDGVLVEAKELHYQALNLALASVDVKYKISWKEHLSVYDGLKTRQKLDMLTEKKGLPIEHHDFIWKMKQEATLEVISKYEPDQRLIELFSSLKEQGYQLSVCSNSIRRSVLTMVSKIGIMEYMDLVISNEDVSNSKPHPEMYWKAMSKMSKLPENTLIVEDSPPGLLAASRARAHVLRVSSPKDVTLDNIYDKLNKIKHETKTMANSPRWQDKNLNVLIPMAGKGSRFANAGYTFPKPLIEVNGKPMIQLVVENLNIDANYTFIVQKEHYELYRLDTLLSMIAPNCNIVQVDGITEGAACTTLLAKQFIDNDQPLVMANSDQFLEWDSNEFMYNMIERNCDGGIVSFRATHPKWSFAKINDEGFVQEVAEKNPISDIATAGIYYWKHGSDYVKYAEQMISKNIRTNNEFYVCPVFNQAIADNKSIRTYDIPKMWGIGTPEDLEIFLKNYTK